MTVESEGQETGRRRAAEVEAMMKSGGVESQLVARVAILSHVAKDLRKFSIWLIKKLLSISGVYKGIDD